MRKTRLLAMTIALLIPLAACSNSDPLDASSSAPTSSSAATDSTSTAGPASQQTVIVGSANFTESVIVGALYAEALRAKGVPVETKERLGSREVYIPALKDGSITVIGEYTGTLLQYLDRSSTATEPDATFLALQKALPDGLTVLDKASAETKDSLTVTRETADRLQLKTIEDLAGKSGSLVLGGPKEWQTRMTGLPGFEKIYGLTFKKFEVTDTGGPITIKALQTKIIDAGNVFTTDPAIAKHDLVSLQDTKGMFGAQNVVPLLSEQAATPVVTETLNAVSAKLTTEELMTLNDIVSNQHISASTAAKEWLTTMGIIS